MWREGLGRIPRSGSATFVAVVADEIVGFTTVGASYSEDGTGGSTRSTSTRHAGGTAPDGC